MYNGMYIQTCILVDTILNVLLEKLKHIGMQDYCERYGANITTVVSDEYSTARNLSGDTLTKMSNHFNKQIPLDKLEEKRQWRANYLKQLIKFKETMKKEEDS